MARRRRRRTARVPLEQHPAAAAGHRHPGGGVMLAPADRRLLLDVLAPPEGYTLDHAVGTTYTLDLVALLRVPLAATALPWPGAGGGRVDNPFALLTALRRNAGRISLFCHAGATRVPASHIPL